MQMISRRSVGLLAAWALVAAGLPAPLLAQDAGFRQALAAAAVADPVIAAFYAARDYRALWTGRPDAARRQAFIKALAGAADHGLPAVRYDAGALTAQFRAVRSERDRAVLDVDMSRAFLRYARDLQSGVLTPAKIDPGIVRDLPRRDPLATLNAFAASTPGAFLRALVPDAPEYTRLMKLKMELESLIGAGGWGPHVPAAALEPGQTGGPVVALRDRLVAMAYMKRSASPSYDAALQKAVQQFQFDHSLAADGVAGESTLTEINREPVERLQSVIVAMERLRWLNRDLGARHIWVNIADFSARIVDNGKVTFETRAVVGKSAADRRTPEFSDSMEYMAVNPSWNVPRSITVKEYLPLLQQNPNAAGHLTIIDAAGRSIPRDSIDFAAYTPGNFPFGMRQPPSDGNALGLVKFMFPNPWNIYLHDTPEKALFSREVRAFSHGCIRLRDPFDFAYALLARQSADPEAAFRAALDSGSETVIALQQPVPVHLVYFTAFTTAKGRPVYWRDVYGRDAKLFEALRDAGVQLRAVQG